MTPEPLRDAEKVRTRPWTPCFVCGASCDLSEWMTEPFCWCCGSYLQREGNRRGLTIEQAKEMARRFNERIDGIIRAARNDGRDDG